MDSVEYEVEMHYGMGNMEFQFLPWKFNGNKKFFWKMLGMAMGITLMEMGLPYYRSLSCCLA